MRAIRMCFIAGLLLLVVGCADRRDATTLADASEVQPSPADNSARRSAQERLARRVAKAMRDPAFRAWVRSALDGSTFREHKLPFARTLGRDGGRGLRALAAADSTDQGSVERDLETADRLEFYFPVPAHRAAWTGDENVLVATAIEDEDAPVAYDTRGRRIVLDPATPPATPVLAVVPQELDFDRPQGAATGYCDTCTTTVTEPGTGGSTGGTGGSYSDAPPSLRMSYFSVNKDFEGWLKGNPEYEVHILAPNSPTDTVKYRTLYCIGEHGDRYWDTNNDSWRGDVVLMDPTQIAAFHQTFPNSNYSVFAIEDDDTSCDIRVDRDRTQALVDAVSRAYNEYKAARDSTNVYQKAIVQARATYDFFKAVADFFNTNDDMIGLAVANSVTGYYSADANWAWIGENANRYGWVKLELR